MTLTLLRMSELAGIIPPVPNSPTLAQKIRALRESRGWSQERLGTEAGGISKDTVVRAEAGKNITTMTMRRLLGALGMTEVNLVVEGDLVRHARTGELPESDVEPFEGDITRGYKPGDVPVVGEAEASSDGLLIWGDEGVVRAQVERWVSRSFADGDPRAYGLVVRNDSMVEKFFPGDVVVAQPRLRVSDGNFAVVYLRSGERLVKRVFRTDNGWVLHSVNPAYRDRTVKDEDVQMMHRIKHSIER